MLMKIEQLVPNLETCQRLKELGFPQGSYFVHYLGDVYKNTNFMAEIAAPTFQEIWNELPDKIEHQNYVFYKVLDTENKYIGYTYLESYAGELWWLIKISTEAVPNITEAIAHLWIQLKEREFI